MKDADYIEKICKDFNILSSYAHTKKYQSKKTYKELYEQFKKEELLIKKAQEVLADKTGKDIYKCSCFTSKNNRQTAYNFINDLYGIDTSKPIHKGIVKRCKAILEFLGETMKKCECGNEKFITVSTIYIDELNADAEPYQNGVEEELTSEDAEYLENQELEMHINICSKCKKHYYWINGDEYIKNNVGE